MCGRKDTMRACQTPKRQLTTVPAEGLSMIAPLAGNPLANVLSNKESLEALASIYSKADAEK